MTYNTPPKGGITLPPDQYANIIAQANAYALTRPWNVEYQLQLRFKGKFCYLDGKHSKEERPFPLGRVTYFEDNVLALSFYTYSNEKYQPSLYRSGKWFGTLEEAIGICELYLI